MYGIVFKLTKDDKNLIDEVDKLLNQFGFERKDFTNFYMNKSESMLPLIDAMDALRAFGDFKNNVTDIKAFKISQWSDFTNFVKKGVE